MEEFDLVCICKHNYNSHQVKNDFYRVSFCKLCPWNPFPGISHEHEFKLDNLKYLEMLSNEKEVADYNKI
jgi:hypothetical protein